MQLFDLLLNRGDFIFAGLPSRSASTDLVALVALRFVRRERTLIFRSSLSTTLSSTPST
jgi:hypothetical protein